MVAMVCQEFLGLPPVPGDVVRSDGSDRSSDEFVFGGAGLQKKKTGQKYLESKWHNCTWIFCVFFVDSTMGFT